MRWTILIFCLIWPLNLAAQDENDDRGFIVGLLESSLGGEGRVVRIDGFKGLFSSTATIEQITVADDDGVWITLSEVSINWRRSALLRGRIDVAELRAKSINMPRKPLPPPGAVPSPEATPFALPELPAALILQDLNIENVNLGAPVLGEAATLFLTGAAALDGGEGDVTLKAQRVDQGRSDQFGIIASYVNETRALMIDLDVSEAPAGLLSHLLDIPDRPSVVLKVTGDGFLSDFGAQLDLRTDGAQRLAGTLALQSEVKGPFSFDVDLGGDVTALFLPDYRDFFGQDVSLRASGSQDASGALTLDQLELDTHAVRLRGSLALNADRWPTVIDVEGEIAHPDGQSVLLPLKGLPTRIDRTDLKVTFDSSKDNKFSGQLRTEGFARTDVEVGSLLLGFDGTLSSDSNSVGSAAGQVSLEADEIWLSDVDLARAVGPSIRSRFDLLYREDQPLALSDVAFKTADWELRGAADVSAITTGMETNFDTTLKAGDLSAFAGLAGLDLTGNGSVSVSGTADLGGAFDISIAGMTRELTVGIPQADTVLAEETTVDIVTRRDTTGTYLDRLELNNPALNATATARLQSGNSIADYSARLVDVAVFTDRASGPVTLDGHAEQNGSAWTISTVLTGPLDFEANLAAQIDPEQTSLDVTAALPDLEPLVPQLRGGATVQARATEADGTWRFDTNISGPFASTTEAGGVYDGARLQASYSSAIPDVSALTPQVSGPVAIQGTVTQVDDGWQINSNVSGPYSSTGTLIAAYEGAKIAADYTLKLPDIAQVTPQFTGSLEAKGSAAQTDNGWRVQSDLSGPYSSVGSVTAVLEDAKLAANYAVRLPDVAPLVPQISGPLDVKGIAKQSDIGWQIQSSFDGPYASTGDVTATLENAILAAEYGLNIPNIAALLPGVDGAVQVEGSATQGADGYDVNASIEGPSGTQAKVAGLVATDGTLNLGTTGQVQLGLANPFLQPRNIAGVAQFDLKASGPPALSSLTGEITTIGTRLALPNVPLSIESLDGSVRLEGSRAVLDTQIKIAGGGTISVAGPVGLDGGFPADLDVVFDAAFVSDPALFSSSITGTAGLDGALSGGARVTGDLKMGETKVLVAPSGMAGVGSIPDIEHIGAAGPVLQTIRRAGLSKEADNKSSAGLPYPIDLNILAPSRIFIRGRGIDAEFGGALNLSGTSSDMISTGQFDLIRGRLDILDKRFDLTEGRVQLQGRFDIDMRLVAETTTQTGTARIIVEGSATSPTVSFEATPEAPEDEVLAQIFFGRDVSQLSAFQALQLASAVATLAGQGGGVSSRLRESLALDDFSVDSDEEGNNTVRAGKYITENVYSDVVVGGEDGPEVSLRIDLTPNITLGGKTDAEGNTGLGFLISKDY